MQMVRRMFADDIDDRYARPAGVVQIRKAVGESGAEMEQSAGRFLRHASVSVSGAGDHAFEQAQHAPHFWDPVQRGNNVDF